MVSAKEAISDRTYGLRRALCGGHPEDAHNLGFGMIGLASRPNMRPIHFATNDSETVGSVGIRIQQLRGAASSR
jgi:hypothetical protein